MNISTTNIVNMLKHMMFGAANEGVGEMAHPFMLHRLQNIVFYTNMLYITIIYNTIIF